MEVDHFDKITSCVRGGMLGYDDDRAQSVASLATMVEQKQKKR